MAHIYLRDVALDFPIMDSSKSLRKTFLKKTGGRILHGSKNQKSHVRALEGITLEINEGDRLGLVGHNGAGKSTLLRVLAGVYHPTQGQVDIKGSISTLFNTNLGLDIDETGYENIFNIGLFLSMSRAEVREKLDDIAEFSELGEFLEMPLRSYSAGMLLRLTFAVATAVNPEILLLDEWLSTGDLRFTEKAKVRLAKLLDKSKIMVLASHNALIMQEYCTKVALLEQGVITMVGEPYPVLKVYHERYHSTSTDEYAF